MTIIKSASLGAVSLLAAAAFAAPSFADGLPSRGRIAASHGCSVSGSVALGTDYVFRGISQTANNATAQSTIDLTCGKFYAGVFASNVDFGIEGTLEVDIYGGYKFSTGKVNWDVGFIYYAYPGIAGFQDADFLELKLGASTDLAKGTTIGGTVFYSPEGQGSVGPVWTLEGSFSQVLPRVSIFSPTFSATVGRVDFTDQDFEYTYWNAGVTLAFREKWSLDLRYWDTDISGGCGGFCDDRFMATVKYSF
jgi:uncharacterized protein (TIGR02001 family)